MGGAHRLTGTLSEISKETPTPVIAAATVRLVHLPPSPRRFGAAPLFARGPQNLQAAPAPDFSLPRPLMYDGIHVCRTILGAQVRKAVLSGAGGEIGLGYR